DAGDAHEQPRPQLPPPGRALAPGPVAERTPGGLRGLVGAGAGLGAGGHHRIQWKARSRMPRPMTQTIVTIDRALKCRAVLGQKSRIMTFTPLMAWYRTAATSPSSSRRTTQLW